MENKPNHLTAVGLEALNFYNQEHYADITAYTALKMIDMENRTMDILKRKLARMAKYYSTKTPLSFADSINILVNRFQAYVEAGLSFEEAMEMVEKEVNKY